MTEQERRALGETRRLVFQNIANGLPAERVMVAMHLSQQEIDQALKAVARKLTEYLVTARQPPIACENIGSIRHNRRRLLALLGRLGDLSLGSDFIMFPDPKTRELVKVNLGRITIQSLDHPEMVEGARHRMAERGMDAIGQHHRVKYID